jgi:hypothetical protein
VGVHTDLKGSEDQAPLAIMFILSSLHCSRFILIICYAEGSKDFSFPLIGTEQTIDVKEMPEHVMAQENSDASNDVIDAAERNESVLENGKADPQSGDVAIEIQNQEHKMPGQCFYQPNLQRSFYGCHFVFKHL